jgi:hypothetical protein
VRKPLERLGGEFATLASTIVRYGPGSRFRGHTHTLGEEFLVLEGTFSDEHASYPAGTYVRNPPGSHHAPFSDEGCTIFVKLHQIDATERRTIRVYPSDLIWRDTDHAGHQRALLFESESEGLSVCLERLAAGSQLTATSDGGDEILLLEGRIQLVNKSAKVFEDRDWLRRFKPRSKIVALTDSLLWVKRGHLHRRGRKVWQADSG